MLVKFEMRMGRLSGLWNTCVSMICCEWNFTSNEVSLLTELLALVESLSTLRVRIFCMDVCRA